MLKPKELTKHKCFPLSFAGWDEAGGDYGDIHLYTVRFDEDFGPIKAGSEFDGIEISHCRGELTCFVYGKTDAEGYASLMDNIVVKFKATPIA